MMPKFYFKIFQQWEATRYSPVGERIDYDTPR